ncbi:TRAP transporter small permease [Bacillus sp. FJAT-50079]|uniref:TRAP transporter small permease n=1 Tax=Bacillus sp. FJAT-50079 TaxID=2833577 RepID=UPI001BC9EF8E|nr:TRAP transporter small permease [Bacillus sp. FJAT-50079]MBS4210614.1 TRAP transporter small permease [Bacillus sp. FJAT-50079]
MEALKKIKSAIDKCLLVFSLTLLTAMVLIIIYQVFSRQVFHYTPSWSEELSRVLFVWVSFLGIAYGFKEKLHIAVGLVVDRMPEKIQDTIDFITKLIIVAYGLVLLVYGWKFTVIMGYSTLPGLKMPSSYLYAIIPITGFFITINGIELLFKKGLHQNFDAM